MAVTRDLWIVLRARDEASRIVRSFGGNLTGTTSRAIDTMTDFEKAMASAALRLNQFAQVSMLTGAAMVGFGAAGLSFIHNVTQVAAEYDRQVRHTLTQVDDMTIGLERIAQIGRNVAREVQVPFEELQETLFFIFSSINVNADQAEKLLKGFAREAVAGQSTIEAAAKSTIAIMNSLGLSVEDLTRIQDVQFQVIRKGIINYEELASVIGRALPATARAGQSFETLGAMIAFLTRNGLSAAMAATSAARALESFAHPVTIKRLGEMGIKVRDAKGEFLPLIAVMEQMNEKLKSLAAPERAKFLQELFTGAGGTIQARRFWDTAFKNFDQFQEMLGFMENSTGVFENAYETMSGSVAAQSELIRNKWMLIKESLGRALLPQLLKLITTLDTVLTWFDKLPEGTKAIIAQFILWGSVISIVVGGLTVLVGAIAFVISGIMAAGSALVVVIGIVVAVAAAIIGFGAALYVAWQKSEALRNVLNGVVSIFRTVWNIVVAGTKEIVDAFKTHLLPSLERLWEVIETKVMPVFMKMMQMWKDEILPKLVEAKNVIVDLVKKGFEVIGFIIDNIVIPAIQRLTDWWQQNSDKMKPLLGIIGQAVKWLLIIGAVLLGLPILAIIAAVGALIVVIEFLIDVIQVLVDFFKKFGLMVRGIWDSIVEKITNAIYFVRDIISSVLNFLYNSVWLPVWNMFAPLVKEVFGLIADIFNFFATLISEIIKDWIIPLVTFFINKWTEIKDGIRNVWNKIVEVVGGAIRSLYNEHIKPILDRIKEFWNEHLSGHFNKAKEIWDKIVGIFKEKIQEIKDFFAGAKDWLVDAGKNIIQGLIDGITGKVKDLRSKLQEITDKIPEWKGPRSVDIKLLTPVGKTIMKSLMSGVESQIPILQRQLGGITAQFNQIPSPTFTMPERLMQTEIPEQRNIEQNFYITTQEINPRVHAAELGFELESRL